MLTTEPIMVNIFWAHSPISFEHMYFLVSILRSTPNCTPLKCRCPFMMTIWIWSTYITEIITTWKGFAELDNVNNRWLTNLTLLPFGNNIYVYRHCNLTYSTKLYHQWFLTTLASFNQFCNDVISVISTFWLQLSGPTQRLDPSNLIS